MPPKERVKKSVRLDPEAIAIMDAYATAHSCDGTEALNAIILSFTHTSAQLPSITATQDKTQWQKTIEARLNKLEAATQVPPITATQDKTQFYQGQVIDARSNIYHQLWRTHEAKQKLGKYTYYLHNKLNIICRAIEAAQSNNMKLEVFAYYPGEQVAINKDGTFVEDRNNGYTGWNYIEPELTPEQPISLVEPTNDETAIEAVEMTPTPTIEPAVEQAATQVPPMRASTEDLLARFATKLNNPGQINTLKGNLESVGLPKLGKGWTVQHDPDGITWLPEDESRKYWVEQPMVVAS